jgi:hypothetical protein
MSELVYLRAIKGVEAQIWHGPPFAGGINDMLKTNQRGNLMYPSAGGDRILKRIKIKDGEEKLGVDKLKELYPLDKK